MPDYSDTELLQQYKDERTRNYAFNLIVRKYQQKVYYHIRKIVINHDDAHDISQNTFIKAWKGLENFREDSQLFTWLYRIATNESLTFLKQKKRQNNVSMEDAINEMGNNLQADPNFNGDRIQMKLQQAILTLPEKQRIVFNMKYFDNMKYEDMSEVLETSVGALKASYHHAVKKIEKLLTDN